ncbi:hypothetical protein ACHHYP_15852 [Achlya hypogyna]|uniref:CCT domain-containing protein n=1 Tax=Achlya hypogyna TaxID=1202772 RepID=A0A1V9Y9Z9_ACHHY|nr:hypothetical protein ACHHYP_15852 [Achlya hypogyna]
MDDVANVDLMSDLFSAFEGDAVVVDEISELFASLEGDQNDAAVVDEIASIFDDLGAASNDADVVDEISAMFDDLEKESSAAVLQDEADAFFVDDVADLFTCLAAQSPAPSIVNARLPPVVARVPTVDSRVPTLDARVPTLDRRIPTLTQRSLPVLGGLVCGPPVFQKATLTREDRVARWKDKRKNRTAKDKPVFESRQQVAAKRRRINGRFAGLETQFIPISTLQN